MTIVSPLPIDPLPVQQATQKLWWLRHLHRERALDVKAGRLAVAPFSVHPNDRVARLAAETMAALTTRATLSPFHPFSTGDPS